MENTMHTLYINNLSKYFYSSGKKSTALDAIECTMNAQERILVYGPNGSGKTTLLKCIYGLLQPDTGSIRINNKPYDFYIDYALRKKISFVSSRIDSFYPRLTLRENLEFFGAPVMPDLSALKKEINRLIALFDLEQYRSMRFQKCSNGIKKRACLVRGLIGRPAILLVDEWSSSLDASSINTFVSYITGTESPHILICASQLTSEYDACFNTYMVLQNSRMVFHGSKKNLLKESRTAEVQESLQKIVKTND